MRVLIPITVLVCLAIGTYESAINDDYPREAYFNGTASLKLNSTVSVHRHSGLSFRTCIGGNLFSQHYNNDTISLDVTNEGLLFIAIVDKHKYEAKLSARLLNNVWHNVNLVYKLGNLNLTAAGNNQIVANATYNSAILQLPDYNVNGSLIVGKGFKGCILRGPGILFNDSENNGALIGTCPPELRGCGQINNNDFGEMIDSCNNEPCVRRGKCVPQPDGYKCQCDTGYSGKNCEIGNGSRCSSNPCKNSATCHEDKDGNYKCTCLFGYTGSECEIPIGNHHNQCNDYPCRNNGICQPIGDNDFKCNCQPGWTGKICEIDFNDCASHPCKNNGICVDEFNNYTCRCQSTGYTGRNCEINIDECSSNHPCLNNGECFDNYGGYICRCPNGYDGTNCEQDLKECQSNPCQNGGLCVDEVGTYHCKCPNEYTGKHCEIRLCDNSLCPDNSICLPDEIGGLQCLCANGYVGIPPNCTVNYCKSNPCINGGVCINEKDNYKCTCPSGWKGNNCQINTNECLSEPCLNGGSCIDGVNGYTCNCTNDFIGENCEREYNPCDKKPCKNNGTCSTKLLSLTTKRDYECTCQNGFTGKSCEINIDECVNVQCDKDRICVDGIGKYECKCKEGYREPNCTLIIDHCAKNPCNNNTCIDLGEMGYKCNCNPGLTGDNCETDIDECALYGNASCNGGICQNTNGSYDCFCRPGFSGIHCDMDINECLCNPCQNNGTCIDEINKFRCICPKGYEGSSCQININECKDNPCQNNGECIDGIAKYTCSCAIGFTGKNCETNINDCHPQSCLHHGKCIDGINNYTCDCIDTGFTGYNCEINIDDCYSGPCVNGGTCIDDIKAYRCRCYPGYTGKRCEIDINECESSPCKYGGECLERSTQAQYKSTKLNIPEIFTHEFSYLNASGYECMCAQGTIGKNCEINIDECSSNPCYEGTCKDKIGKYECECNKGFEGINCQHDIDECLRYKPCEHGTCMDGRADYYCSCEQNWGGKNCSVELIGCRNNLCQNNGTCKPYLINENEHKFNCTCPDGYHGDTCNFITTMSLSESSRVMVNTTREEGYDIQFRFRTTLPNGLLAMGKGTTFYILELANGKLNLHSSILNKWDGVYIGSGLNNSKWQKVFVAINSTHLVLSANEEQTIYPVNQNEGPTASAITFPTTYVGATISYLGNLAHGPSYFVGCTEDIVINGEWIYPEMKSNNVEMKYVDQSCPREEQCLPNPCKAGGHCTDMWRDFSCKCERPYLGHTCQYNMTAATFSHENIKNGFVTVKLSDFARRTVRSIVDISMFIKTREKQGDVFYLGSDLNKNNIDFNSSKNYFISAELKGGELQIDMQFEGREEKYVVNGVALDDGNEHLIQVIRNITLVQVKINRKELFSKLFSSANGQLNVTHLYLGGIPHNSRHNRQIDDNESSTTSTINHVNFKGVIQDVQISNGSETMVVEFYPLNATDIPPPIQFGTVIFDKNKVLPGIVSDNVCQSNPCNHNGTCHVTWNDFWCQCPKGYTGKTCEEMQFCQLQECPINSTCQNLDGGYECTAHATFDGIQTLYSYNYIDENNNHDDDDHNEDDVDDDNENYDSIKKSKINEITIVYRSNNGGTIMHIDSLINDYYQYFNLSVYKDTITIEWKLDDVDDNNNDKLIFGKKEADGNWATILLKMNDDTLTCGFLNTINDSPITSNKFSLTLWKKLIKNGQITIGGLPFDIDSNDNNMEVSYQSSIDANNVDLSDVNITTISSSTTTTTKTTNNNAYKGCLGEVRIGNMLLHYFPFDKVYKNVTYKPKEYFTLIVENSTNKQSIGCRLCFENECQHGHCLNDTDSYICKCPPGYTRDNCSENINECLNNNCQNNSTCIDGIANYTCQCKTGWQGWLCDTDVNECIRQKDNPCYNEGVCVNLNGSFRCECPDEFTGDLCKDPKLITCDNHRCKSGSTCMNIVNPKNGDNFTCTCMPGYEDVYCDVPYCRVRSCKNNGTCDISYQRPQCNCPIGFKGDYCEINIDDCQIDNPQADPKCKNKGICIDGVNSYTCNCHNTGYVGPDCSDDINECEEGGEQICGNGICINLPGTFKCNCDDGYCGANCQLVDPCREDSCANGGTCTCDQSGGYICHCHPDYTGHNCTESKHFLGSQAMSYAIFAIPIGLIFILIIVSVPFLVMTTRNKRATRGTYSPSAQEFSNPRVEMDSVMKPPPEERLI
ncbi:protein crumbs isoform X2 [Aphidius gifuensis]|uniref:protein crumbs isoform X2 n=1 Tax=Aphidius gifuensis TaxID=684658 RepID=UPI001CDD02C2|nr:protein crumbs isoform X2 [Aphidius gifuensis]